MKAFHNDPAIKAKYLKRLRAHVKADELIHGVGWENGKGCASGCTLEKYNHAAYETELGIPQILARLEDCIFEGLANGEAQKFPVRFLSAIPVGADLLLVAPRFIHWMLVNPRHGVIRFANTDQCRTAINGVAVLYEKWIKTGEKPSESAARSAESAAWSAASAAWSAESAAWSAESAAWSAESAAWSAAWSAESAASAAWSAESAASAAWSAESAAYKTMAEYLIKLLKEA